MRKLLIAIAILLSTLCEALCQNFTDPSSLPPMRMIFSQKTVNSKGQILHQATGTIDVQYPDYYIVMGHLHFFGNDSVMYCKDIKSDEVTISKSVLKELLKDADLSELQNSATLSYTAKDGTKHNFTLSNAEVMQERWPESHFQLTDDKIGENTIVTDMR